MPKQTDFQAKSISVWRTVSGNGPKSIDFRSKSINEQHAENDFDFKSTGCDSKSPYLARVMKAGFGASTTMIRRVDGGPASTCA